ncbi:hypothetical protein P152DRAFT_127479 [Eremomyces bilateralis CBS 781.70]|uniref:P-loop containing nucleoside triphosphate hydrolase protein n=1 Tax=Eremomyces bilateralis CBS 781.70 TaxID=1392243 RepID=A0A6G1GEP1_9PEZI|nr:uncharacterized protein P152DRAFT_127479 [Eremomyces bilateralis CBS 781.70]KAF1816547.1 hypothetical protein P152DRAFT_127479 [Eremomyces bilateralis CBS 781.70]
MAAATPYLADQLLLLERSRRQNNQQPKDAEVPQTRGANDETNNTNSLTFLLDDHEGLQIAPGITAISGEASTGKTYLSFRLLAEHLLESLGSSAAIVDTTGVLDLFWLRQVLAATIDGRQSGQSKADAASCLTGLLARIRIIRVFDHIGIQEALDEVKATHDMPDPKDNTRGPADKVEGKVDFVVIDNLSNCFTPLIKTGYTSGNAVLSSFLRSLNALCRSHSVTVVVINTALPPRRPGFSTYSTLPTAIFSDDSAQQASFSLDNIRPTSSVFSTRAAQAQPALGRALQRFASLHIFMHAAASTRGDRAADDHAHSGFHGTGYIGSSGSYHLVVEVIGDKSGGRRGRWDAFRIGRMGEMDQLK